MSNNSMKKLRPAAKNGKPSKRVEEAFRSPSDADSPRVKTSLTLDKGKYNKLRMHSFVEGIPLRDIFDEAMDWYIRTHLDD